MKFKIILTKEFQEEMDEIYEYIFYRLKEPKLASNLILKTMNRVADLAEAPRLYMKIEKFNRYNGLKEEYHRMIVDNYIILYTVDDKNQKIFISHMYYKKRNYLN